MAAELVAHTERKMSDQTARQVMLREQVGEADKESKYRGVNTATTKQGVAPALEPAAAKNGSCVERSSGNPVTRTLFSPERQFRCQVSHS